MGSMIRVFFFVVLLAVPAPGQVPPGPPYDGTTHPNPIVTYVMSRDFKSASYGDAGEIADIELLGLSQSEAKRDAIHIAEPTLKRVRIGRRDTDVTFYPVVRQTFLLSNGSPLVLHSFKFPRSPAPAEILNEVAFAKAGKPEEARFGRATPPERLDIRGAEALLFDNEGELTIFWTEDGVAHVATAKIPQKELFRLMEDLL